jgi:hypothetical protein
MHPARQPIRSGHVRSMIADLLDLALIGAAVAVFGQPNSEGIRAARTSSAGTSFLSRTTCNDN